MLVFEMLIIEMLIIEMLISFEKHLTLSNFTAL